MAYEAYYAARDKIFDFINRDAFGPVCVDEVLHEPPLDTYVCGILWPKRSQELPEGIPSDQQHTEVKEKTPDFDFGGEIDEEQSDIIREANQFRPSVMAISFALPNQTSELKFSFSAGQYVHHDIPVKGKDYMLHEYSRVSLTTGSRSLLLRKNIMARCSFSLCVEKKLTRIQRYGQYRLRIPKRHRRKRLPKTQQRCFNVSLFCMGILDLLIIREGAAITRNAGNRIFCIEKRIAMQ